MIHRAASTLALASLFEVLLSGCNKYESGCEGYVPTPQSYPVFLTPEQYAELAYEMVAMGATETGQMPTSGAGDEATATSGMSTGDDGYSSTSPTEGVSTGGASTGEASTGEASTSGMPTGEMRTDQEICMDACANAGYELYGTDTCTIASPNSEGKYEVTCVTTDICVGGRRHACVRSSAGLQATAAASWLARAAHDEAASVHAFAALAVELASHGAAAGLLAEVEAARADEVRHAAVVTALARAAGASIVMPEVAATPVRGLLAIALENAVEGCVNETWAALSAAHQARYARDGEVRRAFATIAADEARHAELAWTLDAWLAARLSASERAEVAAARSAAVLRLRAELASAADEPALVRLGLPGRAAAQRLAAGLDAALWAQAA